MARKAFKIIFCFSLFLGTLKETKAGFVLDNSVAYINSSFSGSNSIIFDSFFLGATVGKYGILGWNVNYLIKAPGGLTAMEIGPTFGLFMGKSQNWIISGTYNPFVSGSVEGASFQGALSFSEKVGGNSYAGFKIMYHLGSYSSGASTTIAPMIFFAIRGRSQ